MEKTYLTYHVVDLDLGLSNVLDCLTTNLSALAWDISQYCSKTTWNVLMVFAIETGIQLMIYVIRKTVPENHVTGSTQSEEGENSRNKAVQTIGPWQKRIRSQERHFMELTFTQDQNVRKLKKNRKDLLQKGKLRLENLTSDYEGKLKMIAGIKTNLVHIGADISNMIRKIKDGRQQLEARRQQNKLEIQRYEQLQKMIEGQLRHVTNPESSDVYLQEPCSDFNPDVY